MSKQIQVSDETHRRLKLDADANYRSLGGHIDYLMDYYETEGKVPRAVNGSFGAEDKRARGLGRDQLELVPLSDLDPPQKIENTPTSRDLYDLAKRMTEELEEELKYNQDPESRSRQEKVGKEQIQLVWDEYHELKSSEE